MATEESTDILHDFSPIFRQYRDGRVERLIAAPRVPASEDSLTGVRSKDVVIDSEIPISARVYLPGSPLRSQKLPLLVYFHGGGFVTESAFGALYDAHLRTTTAEANVVAVSVEYRLAPEHPLPAAHEDSWLALKWIASGAGGEEWISEFADLNRVFIAGDSAGGNLAHYVSLRASIEPLGSIKVIGAILNCPFFNGEECLVSEKDDPLHGKDFVDRLCMYVWNGATGLDDPRNNPLKDENLRDLKLKKLLIFTAEHDFLRGRALLYKQGLKESGWEGEAELIDSEGENHVYSVLFPSSEKSKSFFKKVASFINDQ